MKSTTNKSGLRIAWACGGEGTPDDKKRIPERVRQLPDKPSLAKLFDCMCNLDILEPETGGGGGNL